MTFVPPFNLPYPYVVQDDGRLVDPTAVQGDFDALAQNASLLAAAIADALFTPGDLKASAGTDGGAGWLLCDGSTYSTSDYGALFAAIGYTYGGSAGSFQVPNTLGRMLLGVGTAFAPGATAHTLGQSSGEEAHKLTTSELPTNAYTVAASGLGAAAGTWLYFTNGGNQDHNNMPPYLAVNYFIRT